MRYEIIGSDGRNIQVDAVDWMMAMSQAIKRWGIEVSGWVCEARPNGDMQVTDPRSGRSWEVRRLESAATPRPAPAATGAPPPLPAFLTGGKASPRLASPSAAPEPSRRQPLSSRPVLPPPAATAPAPPAPAPAPAATAPAPAPAPAAPPPVAAAPPSASGGDEGPPDGLAEQLFDVSFDIAGAGDQNAACSKALEIALDMVPCEAGSVLRGTINDSDLTFVAVSGPAARDLLGRTLPFGQGLVGVAFDLGITVQVNDVTRDPRHNTQFDDETGFRTRSVLSVPVRTATDFYGCLQLLNPKSSRFLPWHVEVAETVARSLASTLSGAS